MILFLLWDKSSNSENVTILSNGKLNINHALQLSCGIEQFII